MSKAKQPTDADFTAFESKLHECCPSESMAAAAGPAVAAGPLASLWEKLQAILTNVTEAELAAISARFNAFAANPSFLTGMLLLSTVLQAIRSPA
jgi:hypothetical protein